jgi:hypothetical protein
MLEESNGPFVLGKVLTELVCAGNFSLFSHLPPLTRTGPNPVGCPSVHYPDPVRCRIRHSLQVQRLDYPTRVPSAPLLAQATLLARSRIPRDDRLEAYQVQLLQKSSRYKPARYSACWTEASHRSAFGRRRNGLGWQRLGGIKGVKLCLSCCSTSRRPGLAPWSHK